MTRILHVTSGLGTGGAEGFLVALATRLQARGVQQSVVSVTSGGANAQKLRDGGIAVSVLGVRGIASAVGAYGRMLDTVTRADPTVIQGWMYHGDLFATIMHALARKKPRLMWNIRCSDMRLEDYALQLRLVVKACAALSARPDIIVANSRAGGDVHQKAGYKPRRLEIVPNGIDTERFRPDTKMRAEVRSELGLPPDAFVVIHVARVDPMKDHLTLLSAIEGTEGIYLVMAGKGTATLSRPPHVIGLGERHDVPRLLTAGDVIVSSSAYGEGFSNAVAEGMSAQLIPIITDVGDAREIAGETGAIVGVRDPAALSRAIDHMKGLPASERLTRGQAARERIDRLFSLEHAVDRFAALYSP